MPRVTDVTSDSETDRVVAGSAKKKYSTKKTRRASSDVDDVEEVEKEVGAQEEETGAEGEEEDEDEEGGEEEYEIEKILDAKKGQFSGGRLGYFVKWKGYGDEHNSWVDEQDAGNAQELIDHFWAEKKKNKLGPRKSEPVKSKPRPSTEKASRKSLAEVESSIEPDSHPKKRARPKKDEPSDAMEVEEIEEEEQRTKKKPRKSNGAGRSKKQESDEEEIFGSMKKHMNTASWEGLIESIDTVERESDGELYVFFTLKNEKKRVRESSRIAALKFPQKLIMFYESNLRWKSEDDPTDAE